MKWEYRVWKIEHSFLEAAQDVLNRFGEDGWELVAISPEEQGRALVFKRPEE